MKGCNNSIIESVHKLPSRECRNATERFGAQFHPNEGSFRVSIAKGAFLKHISTDIYVLRCWISVTRCSKLVKTTRNESGTVPKTSRKLKQTMLDLYPDEFYIDSTSIISLPAAKILVGFGSAHPILVGNH